MIHDLIFTRREADDGSLGGEEHWVMNWYKDCINVEAFLPRPLSTWRSVVLIDAPEWLKSTETAWNRGWVGKASACAKKKVFWVATVKSHQDQILLIYTTFTFSLRTHFTTRPKPNYRTSLCHIKPKYTCFKMPSICRQRRGELL